MVLPHRRPRSPSRLPRSPFQNRGMPAPTRVRGRGAMAPVPHPGQLVPLACPARWTREIAQRRSPLLDPAPIHCRRRSPSRSGVLLDVDGTLVAGGQAHPGRGLRSLSVLRQRVASGSGFLTNTTPPGPPRRSARAGGAGIEVPVEDVFTPVVAALRFLGQHPAERCHLLLSGAGRAFRRSRCRDRSSDYVLVGTAARSADTRSSTPLPPAEEGPGCSPSQRGRWWQAADGPSLDTGAFVALLEHASGTDGPELWQAVGRLLRDALADLGCAPAEALVVGDDPDADAAGRARSAPPASWCALASSDLAAGRWGRGIREWPP